MGAPPVEGPPPCCFCSTYSRLPFRRYYPPRTCNLLGGWARARVCWGKKKEKKEEVGKGAHLHRGEPHVPSLDHASSAEVKVEAIDAMGLACKRARERAARRTQSKSMKGEWR